MNKSTVNPKMSHRTSVALLIAMAAVRLGSMLILLKLLSSMFGPDSFGILSQIIGVSAIFYMFAGGGVTNGILKHVAASPTQDDRARWLSAAAAIAAVSSVALSLLAVVLFLFGGKLVFGDNAFAPVFLIIAAAQAVIGGGNLALAYLSGANQLKSFAAAHSAGSLLTLATVAWLASVIGFKGAVIGSALIPLGPALLGLAFLWAYLRQERNSFRKPETRQILQLLKFTGVLLVAVTTVPLVQLYIRSDLGRTLGWEIVGHWQAVARMSDAYMQVFGILFMNFLLPQLSQSSRQGRRSLLKFHGARFITLFLVGAVALWLLKDIAIRIAFSAEFLPATSFLAAQLLGDLFKIAALVFVYYFLASGRLWVQSVTEILQGAATLLIFVLLKPALGAQAAVYGHAIACLAVLATVALLFILRPIPLERTT